MNTVWELVKRGEYEHACQAAEEEYSKFGSLTLQNKVFALLSLRRFEEAAALCREIIRQEARTAGEYTLTFLGVCYWLQGKRDEAVASWKEASIAPYADAAGGVESRLLLFYASVKCADAALRKEAARELRQLCRRSRADNWPGPVGRFVLGEVAEEQLLTKVSPESPLRDKEMCQAAFYIGVVHLMNGNEQGFRESMALSANQDPVSLSKQEHYLAKAEYASAAGQS